MIFCLYKRVLERFLDAKYVYIRTVATYQQDTPVFLRHVSAVVSLSVQIEPDYE